MKLRPCICGEESASFVIGHAKPAKVRYQESTVLRQQFLSSRPYSFAQTLLFSETATSLVCVAILRKKNPIRL